MGDCGIRPARNWIAASRQVLDDAPMLQSYIDGRLMCGLMYRLKYVEDDAILNGDGSKPAVLVSDLRGDRLDRVVATQALKPLFASETAVLSAAKRRFDATCEKLVDEDLPRDDLARELQRLRNV